MKGKNWEYNVENMVLHRSGRAILNHTKKGQRTPKE
jgi:hypothetical protein